MTDALRADLGFLKMGTRVSLELSSAAYVRLMEPEAVLLAQQGFGYRYFGGLFGRGRVTQVVPHHGQWFQVVDLGDLVGSIAVSPVQIDPPPAHLA